MTRQAGTTRERIFQALIQRYKADGEAALVKIDALIRGEVLPGHEDVIGSIDKQIAKVAFAEEKMATLRQHYGTNQAAMKCRQGVGRVSAGCRHRDQSVDIHDQVRQKCTKKRQNVDTSTPLRHLADTLSVDIFFLNKQRIPTVIGDQHG